MSAQSLYTMMECSEKRSRGIFIQFTSRLSLTDKRFLLFLKEAVGMIVQDIEFVLKDGTLLNEYMMIREIRSGRVPADQRDPG